MEIINDDETKDEKQEKVVSENKRVKQRRLSNFQINEDIENQISSIKYSSPNKTDFNKISTQIDQNKSSKKHSRKIINVKSQQSILPSCSQTSRRLSTNYSVRRLSQIQLKKDPMLFPNSIQSKNVDIKKALKIKVEQQVKKFNNCKLDNNDKSLTTKDELQNKQTKQNFIKNIEIINKKYDKLDKDYEALKSQNEELEKLKQTILELSSCLREIETESKKLKMKNESLHNSIQTSTFFQKLVIAGKKNPDSINKQLELSTLDQDHIKLRDNYINEIADLSKEIINLNKMIGKQKYEQDELDKVIQKQNQVIEEQKIELSEKESEITKLNSDMQKMNVIINLSQNAEFMPIPKNKNQSLQRAPILDTNIKRYAWLDHVIETKETNNEALSQNLEKIQNFCSFNDTAIKDSKILINQLEEIIKSDNQNKMQLLQFIKNIKIHMN